MWDWSYGNSEPVSTSELVAIASHLGIITPNIEIELCEKGLEREDYLNAWLSGHVGKWHGRYRLHNRLDSAGNYLWMLEKTPTDDEIAEAIYINNEQWFMSQDDLATFSDVEIAKVARVVENTFLTFGSVPVQRWAISAANRVAGCGDVDPELLNKYVGCGFDGLRIERVDDERWRIVEISKEPGMFVRVGDVWIEQSITNHKLSEVDLLRVG